MDFVKGLPKFEGKNVILVVVDRLTKFRHLLRLTHPFSAQEANKVFLNLIIKLLGVPKTIVSDKDRILTSSFWQELFKKLGVGLHLSTTYQSDG